MREDQIVCTSNVLLNMVTKGSKFKWCCYWKNGRIRWSSAVEPALSAVVLLGWNVAHGDCRLAGRKNCATLAQIRETWAQLFSGSSALCWPWFALHPAWLNSHNSLESIRGIRYGFRNRTTAVARWACGVFGFLLRLRSHVMEIASIFVPCSTASISSK